MYQNPSKLPPPHHCSIRTNQTTSTLWLVIINYFSFAIAFMTCQCHSRALLRILYCTTTSTYVSTKNSRTTSEVFKQRDIYQKGFPLFDMHHSPSLLCVRHALAYSCIVSPVIEFVLEDVSGYDRIPKVAEVIVKII